MRMTLLTMLLVAIALAWIAIPGNANAYELGGIEYDARVSTAEGTQATDTQWYAIITVSRWTRQPGV